MQTRTALAPALAMAVALGLAAPSAATADPLAVGPNQAQTASGGVAGFTVGNAHTGSFDWAGRAHDYDAFVYDSTDRGDYSTLRTDSTALNMPSGESTYKLPAYYGDTRVAGTGGDGNQEALNQIASVVGATLVGIDKSDQNGTDYVDQLRTFFHPSTGVAMNTPSSSPSAPGSQSIWYSTIANVLYYMLGSQYPDATDMPSMLRSIADRYDGMVRNLGGASADFTMQDYDFATGKRIAGNRNEGGEAATGAVAILLWANARFGDARYLESARWAMDALERSDSNLYYEVLPVLAPYLAARLNAQTGSNYDVQKYIRWLMQDSSTRPGWGTLRGSWTGVDVSGLSGSRTDSGGYAFAMNSFATPLLAATAKYDATYADVIGQWMASIDQSARSFYADQMPADRQYYGTRFIDDPAHVIAYEGLMRTGSAGIQARGDIPERSGSWGVGPSATSLGLYGSSWVGFMGAAISATDAPGVLRTDLDALDFFGANTFPTALYYNATSQSASVSVRVDHPSDLYDTVSGRYVARGVTSSVSMDVPARGSVVLVTLPAGTPVAQHAGSTVADGVAFAWDRSPRRDLAASGSGAVDGVARPALTDSDDTTTTALPAGESTTVIDLGSARRVSETTMRWVPGALPAQIRVETSVDGHQWSAGADAPAAGAQQSIRFDPRTARYVRMIATSAQPASIRGIEVRDGDLAAGREAQVSSTANDLNIAAALTDGSAATRWESQPRDPQSIDLDLGADLPLGQVRLVWEAAAARAYTLDVSSDATAWTRVASVTAGASGEQVHRLPDATHARYVRLIASARATQYAYSLFSFSVYAPTGSTSSGDGSAPGTPGDGEGGAGPTGPQTAPPVTGTVTTGSPHALASSGGDPTSTMSVAVAALLALGAGAASLLIARRRDALCRGRSRSSS